MLATYFIDTVMIYEYAVKYFIGELVVQSIVHRVIQIVKLIVLLLYFPIKKINI